MKSYINIFATSETGIETIEFIGILVVSAVLIGAVAVILSKQVTSLKSYDNVATNAVKRDLNQLYSKNNVHQQIE